MFTFIYLFGITFVLLNIMVPIAMTDCYYSLTFKEPKKVSTFEFYVWRLIALLVIGLKMKYDEVSQRYIVYAKTENGDVVLIELIY